MLAIGKTNLLTISQLTAQGAILTDDSQQDAVLLPKRFVKHNAQIGDEVAVFLYHDSADRLVATTESPYAEVGDFAVLQVCAINKVGAFLSWGLKKDLLVPPQQQIKSMQVNRRYLVKVCLDKQSQRIVATAKVNQFINIYPANYKMGERVEILITGKTDLGYKAIINNAHWGLIYQNEVFHPLHIGEKRYAFIKKIREDGNVDLSLQRTGKGKVSDFAPQLLDYLHQHDGKCALNDHSSPEQIQKVFGVSKKTFKSAIGHLMKQTKIKQTETGIELL